MTTSASNKKFAWVRKGLSRRVFMRSMAGAGLATVASSPFVFVPKTARASESLVLPSWGGTFEESRKKAFWDPFTKETGIEIVYTEAPDMAKAEAQVKSGQAEWDIFEPDAPLIAAAERKGLFEPLDYSIIDASGMIYPSAKRQFSVAYMIFSGGIGWNSTKHPKPEDHPKDFPEFWDPKSFPGLRGIRGFSPAYVLEMALLGDGVPPDKVYPIDVDRAFASLEKIRPYVQNWIQGTQQTVSLLETNELDFTTTFNGRVYAEVQAGQPLAFSFDQVFNAFAFIGVLRGSKHKTAAMRAIAYMMDPAREVTFAELMAYQPVKTAAVGMLPAGIKEWMPAVDNPKNLLIDYDWWGEPGRLDMLTERFNELKLS